MARLKRRGELREKYFQNRPFACMDEVEEQLFKGLHHLGQSPQTVKSFVGWEWILNSISNANLNNASAQPHHLVKHIRCITLAAYVTHPYFNSTF